MWKLICGAGPLGRELRLPVGIGLAEDDRESAKKIALYELQRVASPRGPRLVWMENHEGGERETESHVLE